MKITLFYTNFRYELIVYRELGTTAVDNKLTRIQVFKIKELYL